VHDKILKSGSSYPSGGQDLKIPSQPDAATWQRREKSTKEDFIFFLTLASMATAVQPPEVQTDLDFCKRVYDFVSFLALITNITLDFSVDAHTERKWNDKFELKNSKTQNNV
jgi:hypothetical protein